MHICKNCNDIIPDSIIVNNIKKNIKRRKFCLECCPLYGKHNKTPSHDLIRKCTTCQKEYRYIVHDNTVNRKGCTLSQCNTCISRSRRHKNKEKAIEYKGGKCQICNYNKCYSALVFHHLDPNKKDFSFSQRHGYKWEHLQKELDKCVLLCNRCHSEIHEGIAVLETRVGIEPTNAGLQPVTKPT